VNEVSVGPGDVALSLGGWNATLRDAVVVVVPSKTEYPILIELPVV
jgi:hypothetical protein